MGASAYQYNQVEAALVAAFDVGPTSLPAFRGRLRHLRKHGVPDLPVVGKGGVSTYSRQDLVELVWAVELVALGVSPARIPDIIEASRSELGSKLGLEFASRNLDDWWFVIVPNAITGEWHMAEFTLEKALDKTLASLRKKFGRVAAGNLGQRFKKVFEVVADTEPAKRGR